MPRAETEEKQDAAGTPGGRGVRLGNTWVTDQGFGDNPGGSVS